MITNKYFYLVGISLSLTFGLIFLTEEQEKSANTVIAPPSKVQAQPSNDKGDETRLLSKDLDAVNDEPSKNDIPIHRIYKRFSTTEEYAQASRFGALPSDMNDTALESFFIDSEGNLVINDSIKNIMEFFLLAVHSEGYDQAVERLYEYIELTLPESAAQQANQIANLYLSYKENLRYQTFGISSDLRDSETLSSIRKALEERQAFRKDQLGLELSESLFGYEEQYERFSLSRLEINADDTLSAAEKDQRLAKAEQQLPESLASKMRYQREEQNLKKKISYLQQEGNNEQEVYELRKAFYGEKVAKRLAYLEDNSPEWQQRVASFRSDQNHILQDNSLSSAEKNLRISQLKQAQFSEKEQVKLAVQQIRGT